MKSKCCGAEVKTFLHCSECGKVDWTAEGESAADEILKKCFDNSNQGTSQGGTMSAKLAKQQFMGMLRELLNNRDDDGVLDSSTDDILRETADYLDTAIAEARLEAVEKWMAMTYDCIGNNGVIATEHFNYLAELRKAAGRGE